MQSRVVPTGCAGRRAAACPSLAATQLGNRARRRASEIVPCSLGRRHLTLGARGVAARVVVQRACRGDGCPRRFAIAAPEEEIGGAWHFIGRLSGSAAGSRRQLLVVAWRPRPGRRRVPFGAPFSVGRGGEGVPFEEAILGATRCVSPQVPHLAHMAVWPVLSCCSRSRPWSQLEAKSLRSTRRVVPFAFGIEPMRNCPTCCAGLRAPPTRTRPKCMHWMLARLAIADPASLLARALPLRGASWRETLHAVSAPASDGRGGLIEGCICEDVTKSSSGYVQLHVRRKGCRKPSGCYSRKVVSGGAGTGC